MASYDTRKQMIEARIKTIAKDLNINNDHAFMRLAYAVILDIEYHDPLYDEDVVDGGSDKQLDIISIKESQDQGTIHILQVKNSDKYSGNVVIQMRNGLDYVFKRPEAKFTRISNDDLVSKIHTVRHLFGRLGLKNIKVVVHYVAKGDTTKLSPDFLAEKNDTIVEYSSEFQDFDFKIWGINELVEQSYETEHNSNSIDVDIPILYQWNIPTYSQHSAGDVKAVICTVKGSDLARLVNEHLEWIFEENVRTYLGSRRKVNAEILRTCSDENEAEYFWFFNNGITIVCSDFDVVYSANPPHIKIRNTQIVNGCQTSMTLAEAYKKGVLNEKVQVMLKVYGAHHRDFIDKITLATNHQNAVTNRDLRSNDITQKDLEKVLGDRGYYYERKPRTHSKLSKKERERVISNEKLGQSYLAVVMHHPAIAMAQPSKIWEDFYENIYKSSPDKLLASYLIYSYCIKIRPQIKTTGLSSLEEAILKYGTFHIARVVGSYQLGEHWDALGNEKIREFIEKVEKDPSLLERDHEKARTLIKDILTPLISGNAALVFSTFKKGDIEKKVDEELLRSGSR